MGLFNWFKKDKKNKNKASELNGDKKLDDVKIDEEELQSSGEASNITDVQAEVCESAVIMQADTPCEVETGNEFAVCEDTVELVPTAEVTVNEQFELPKNESEVCETAEVADEQTEVENNTATAIESDKQIENSSLETTEDTVNAPQADNVVLKTATKVEAAERADENQIDLKTEVPANESTAEEVSQNKEVAQSDKDSVEEVQEETESESNVEGEVEVQELVENEQLEEAELCDENAGDDEKKQSKKEKVGFFKRIKNALKKTKDAISSKIDAIFHKEIDDEFFEDLEDILISSDLGFETSEEIIETLRVKCKKEKLKTCEEAKTALREVISEMMSNYEDDEFDETFPKVIIVVGVNGVGKTTSIGKLANYYSNLGKKVVVVAGDTFRAAASAQLNVWANRADVKIVKQEEGADSASVVFDGISFAKSKGFDVVLVDTAGRLHNKVNLMEELSKVNRVATKNWENAHFERYIVLDATTGQNAINQVREFDSAIDLSGIVLTKLDGTAKGGIVVSICNEFEIPVKFVGVGEGIDDIVPFNVEEFVDGII